MDFAKYFLFEFARKSGEEEIDVFCEGAVQGGPSSVLNLACEHCDNCFKMTRTEMLQSKHLSLVGP